MRLAGLILAGGEGRRMGGGGKAFIGLGGKPLLAHAIARLGPQVEALWLSANGDAARFAPFGLEVLADQGGSFGPLSGILQGLRRAGREGFSHVLTAPVDTPFLPGDFAARLTAAGGAAMAASDGRAHPACALWPVEAAAPLAAFLAGGGRRVMDFARGQGLALVEWPGPWMFFNINTPEDLAAAEKRITSQAV